MANRYWVGGSGTWNTTSTTNWSASSGGASGASVPTAADSVFFDQAATYTVTMTGALTCLDITVSAGTVTFATGTSPTLAISGSMSLVAATVWNSTGTITFNSTTTGRTITTNGVAISGAVTFNGVGGGWTLGSALNTVFNAITITAGTLNTSAASSYALSCGTFTTANSASAVLTLNASTFTITSSSISFGASSVINAGTSQIICPQTLAVTFAGGGKTFYDVSFTGAVAVTSVTITGANTFNNLSFVGPTPAGFNTVFLNANQTINGTLTSSGTTETQRVYYRSNTLGTARTLTLANPVTISNSDFRDITAATNSITATSSGGDCGGNTNITFSPPKTVYWNLAGAQNWSATGWATSSGGTPAAANFPLAQDTAVFDDTGSVTGTITFNAGWNIGTIDMSSRTTAMTLNSGSLTAAIYGSWLNGTGTTLSGTGLMLFAGRGNTQQVSGNGRAFTQSFEVQNIGGVLQLTSAVTTGSARTFTLTNGTLDLNGFTLTCGLFGSTGTATRTIAFGAGNITVNGTGTVWNTSTTTALSITGTPVVNVSNATATAATVAPGALTEASSISFNFTTGTYALTFPGTSGYTARSVNFTGFAGTWGAISTVTLFGDLTISTGMTLTASANVLTFGSTSATPRTITTNGKTLDFPVTFNGVGGTWQLQSTVTVGATRTTTLTNGTLDLNGNSLYTGFFSSNNSNTRTIAFGAGALRVNGAGGTLWTTATTTNLTVTGTPNVIIENGTASATTVSSGTSTEANSISFTFNSGTYTLTLSAGTKRNLSFNGFSGTVSNAAQTIFGDLFLSTAMTLPAGANAWTFASTSGTPRTIRSGGKTMDFPVTFNGIGGTWQLTDAMTLGSTRTLTHTNGTIDLNGKTLTAGASYTTAAGTKNLTFNAGTVVCPAASVTAFNNAAPTGFTTTAGTGTGFISMTAATAKTFVGGGSTFNCNLNQGGAGALTITGANTFTNIANTVQPATITFPASTTTTVQNFTVSGTSGNLVTLNSSSAGVQATLSDSSGTVSCDYLSIQDSAATGGASWYAGANSTNVSNNTGWIFTAPPAVTSPGNFFTFLTN